MAVTELTSDRRWLTPGEVAERPDDMSVEILTISGPDGRHIRVRSALRRTLVAR
jgi:hypothetical protein